MNNYRIQFDQLEWETPVIGVKQKAIIHQGKRLRLLRFEDDFIEADWCTQGHVGFVLAGEMKIDFNGHVLSYKKGDGLWIPPGLESRHKAEIAKGKFVELILFEDLG